MQELLGYRRYTSSNLHPPTKNSKPEVDTCKGIEVMARRNFRKFHEKNTFFRLKKLVDRLVSNSLRMKIYHTPNNKTIWGKIYLRKFEKTFFEAVLDAKMRFSRFFMFPTFERIPPENSFTLLVIGMSIFNTHFKFLYNFWHPKYILSELKSSGSQ